MAWNEPGNGKDPWKKKDGTPNDQSLEAKASEAPGVDRLA